MPEVNQQAIAEQLQLSRAMVSRCFTNHPGINPTTRAKVFQLADELGYKHLEMRVPRKRKAAPNAIGVLICVDDFATGPGAGLDECLPTVLPCEVAGSPLADHGELWNQPGVWITRGGWRGMHHWAVEPTNLPLDRLADGLLRPDLRRLVMLQPGETRTWQVTLTLG